MKTATLKSDLVSQNIYSHRLKRPISTNIIHLWRCLTCFCNPKQSDMIFKVSQVLWLSPFPATLGSKVRKKKSTPSQSLHCSWLPSEASPDSPHFLLAPRVGQQQRQGTVFSSTTPLRPHPDVKETKHHRDLLHGTAPIQHFPLRTTAVYSLPSVRSTPSDNPPLHYSFLLLEVQGEVTWKAF